LFLRQPLPNPAPARYNGARKITPGGLPSSSTSMNLRPARADEAIEWRSLFAAPHESGYGTSRKSSATQSSVVIGGWRTSIKPHPIQFG
jgi:hypothetical protein